MGRRTPIHAEVYVHDQNLVEKMIKKFSRKVKKCGILDEVKSRRYFVKKSIKKRLKKKNKKRLSQQSNEKHKNKYQNEYN